MAIKTKNVDVNDSLRKQVFNTHLGGTLTASPSLGVIPIDGLGTYGGDVESVSAAVNTMPTGDAIEIQIANGSTDLLTSALSITASTAKARTTDVVLANAAVVDGDMLDVDIDQVGTSVAGANMTVTVVVRVNGSGYNL